MAAEYLLTTIPIEIAGHLKKENLEPFVNDLVALIKKHMDNGGGGCLPIRRPPGPPPAPGPQYEIRMTAQITGFVDKNTKLVPLMSQVGKGIVNMEGCYTPQE